MSLNPSNHKRSRVPTFGCGVFLLMLFLYGCGSHFKHLQIDTSNFEKASIAKSELTDSLSAHQQQSVHNLSGKARISYRTADETQNGTVVFEIKDDLAYFRLKNRLGIEGVRIWLTADSVYVYDIINKQAARYGRHQIVQEDLYSLSKLNFFELASPKLSDDIRFIREDNAHFLVGLKNDEALIVQKKDYRIIKSFRPVKSYYYDVIDRQQYRSTKDGFSYPARLTVTSNRHNKTIFLLIKELDTATLKAEDLKPDIPESIHLYHH